MKIRNNRFKYLLYFFVLCALTVFANGCLDEDNKEDERHKPGVYTGNNSVTSPMIVVVGDTSVTRFEATLHFYSSSTGASRTLIIDTTGNWALVWSEEDYCYNFKIETVADGVTISVKGIAGINVDDVPTVHCFVTISDSTSTIPQAFYLDYQP